MTGGPLAVNGADNSHFKKPFFDLDQPMDEEAETKAFQAAVSEWRQSNIGASKVTIVREKDNKPLSFTTVSLTIKVTTIIIVI